MSFVEHIVELMPDAGGTYHGWRCKTCRAKSRHVLPYRSAVRNARAHELKADKAERSKEQSVSKLLTDEEIIAGVMLGLVAKGDVATLSVSDQNLYRDCEIAVGLVRCQQETSDEARARVTRAVAGGRS